jgi:CheY-like chemotaxis protein
VSAVRQTRRGVLVVDDDFDIQDVVRLLLEDEGFPVVTAGNGQEAIEQLRRGLDPCLILLDLMMPVMDGWQFRAAQQQDPALASIPVIVFSAGGRATAAAAASSMGAVGYLAKPIDFEALLETVQRHC